jgi:hypothetical protein
MKKPKPNKQKNQKPTIEYCGSIFVLFCSIDLYQGLTNYDPRPKSGPLPGFENKGLLGLSQTHSFL